MRGRKKSVGIEIHGSTASIARLDCCQARTPGMSWGGTFALAWHQGSKCGQMNVGNDLFTENQELKERLRVLEAARVKEVLGGGQVHVNDREVETELGPLRARGSAMGLRQKPNRNLMFDGDPSGDIAEMAIAEESIAGKRGEPTGSCRRSRGTRRRGEQMRGGRKKTGRYGLVNFKEI